MQLDIEAEAIGSFFGPTAGDGLIGQPIESGVDFDEVKVLGVPFKPAGGGDLFRIPIGDETGISPTSGACQDLAHDETSVGGKVKAIGVNNQSSNTSPQGLKIRIPQEELSGESDRDRSFDKLKSRSGQR